MKKMFFLMILSALFLNCIAQGDKSIALKYEGVDNDPMIDPDFAKGSEAIKKAITKDLAYLNLYEYAHALPELYQLIDNGTLDIREWKSYIDTLEKQAKTYMNDTIQAIWAVEYLGLIPLQADFFLASLQKSKSLKEKYPVIFNELLNNTSQMIGLAFKESNYDSLVVLNDTKGESTLWYFLQLEDCRLFDLIKNKYDKKELLPLGGLNEFSSTYKTPFYLQKRKWQSIQRRMKESEDDFCMKFAEKMNKITIFINDKDQNYFSGLEEGTDRNKTKEF